MSVNYSGHSIRKGIVVVASSLLLFALLLVAALSSAGAVKAALSAEASARASAADAPKPSDHMPNCDPGWGVVSSPNVGTNSNVLYGVTAISSNDVWAVGSYPDDSNTSSTLTEHWDGSQWSVVSSPNAGTDGSAFNAVTAISTNDVWAVGYYYDTVNGAFQTLTEHWDGSTWSVVSSANVGTDENRLSGVAAVTANDVWAVGYYHNTGAFRNQTLTEHWNGTTWSVVSSPSAGTNDNSLNAVTTVASSDVWAVGYYYDTVNGAFQTLTEHWNGSQWSIVSSPNPGAHGNYLFGVTAVASDDVWAVGNYIAGPSDYRTLTEHWDGTQWSVVASPNPDTLDINLTAITAVASNDVWTVGRYLTGSSDYQTLTEHWDGTQWSVVASPNGGTNGNFLNGVAANASGDVWAAGFYLNGSAEKTLTEHYSSLCLTSTPSPTYTLTSTPTATITLTPSSTPTTCTLEWRVIDSPNVGTSDNFLYGVAAISSNDVWAVGKSGSSSATTLTEHWDGSQWSVVSSPNPATFIDELHGVTSISSDDVWAVGYQNNSNGYQTLTEHWDGSTWSVVSSANVAASDNYLDGITAIASDDVWAVGYYDDGSGVSQTLTEHWDGSTWSVVSSPNVGTYSNGLKSITASASNDLWAVGYHQTSSNGARQTLTEHWNGSTWSVLSSANPGTDSNFLNGVTAIAPNDVWAVGRYNDINFTYQALIEHWDGSTWSVVSSPSPDTFDELYAVAAVSSGDVWAAGYGSGTGSQTLTEHWDGTTWSVVASPDAGTFLNYLNGIAAIASRDVWTVGDDNSANDYQTLTEHYFSPCDSPTPTATNTPTSVPSTGTPTLAPTNTPTLPTTDTPTLVPTDTSVPTNTPVPTNTALPATATPTVCTLSFEDVPAGSTFYTYVECMACRGIINGYPCSGPGEPCNANNDPYFRPGSNVTRGQFAKITANAVGFNEPAGDQQYEDVLPGSTFFDFIWRLSNHNIIAGYPCGGAGEPCGPNSLPYFRPNANITRGQIAKVDANAAGYSDTPGAQQYEDVLPGSTFFDFIWRLADRGLVSGYLCGGAGEPCGANNLPYFRPSANATRGQASKIVSNTFFPECQTLASR